MTYQYSVAVRNAALDAREVAIGPSPVLRLFSGAEPANCAAADPSGLLATINLPVDWMAPAASGSKAKSGVWSGVGSAAGIVASWRIYDSGLVACHIPGNTVDMTFDNTNIAIGQTVTINTFQWTAGNA
mgnify:FL=1